MGLVQLPVWGSHAGTATPSRRSAESRCRLPTVVAQAASTPIPPTPVQALRVHYAEIEEQPEGSLTAAQLAVQHGGSEAAGTSLPLQHYLAVTAVSCIPYVVVVVATGAGLADVAQMTEDDFQPSQLGTGFWVVAGVGGVLGLGATIWAARYGTRMLRRESEAERQVPHQALLWSPVVVVGQACHGLTGSAHSAPWAQEQEQEQSRRQLDPLLQSQEEGRGGLGGGPLAGTNALARAAH